MRNKGGGGSTGLKWIIQLNIFFFFLSSSLRTNIKTSFCLLTLTNDRENQWQITYLWPGLLGTGWGEWVRHVITNEFPPFIWLKHFLKILNNVVISSLTFSFNEKSLGSDGGYENGKYYVLQHDNFSVHLTVTRAVAMKMCFGKF